MNTPCLVLPPTFHNPPVSPVILSKNPFFQVNIKLCLALDFLKAVGLLAGDRQFPLAGERLAPSGPSSSPFSADSSLSLPDLSHF